VAQDAITLKFIYVFWIGKRGPGWFERFV